MYSSSNKGKMERRPCEHHPEQYLMFQCVECHEMLCRDCKLTEHEGHQTRDISKVLYAAVTKINRVKNDLLFKLSHVQSDIQIMTNKDIQFQLSKRSTENSINERADKIIAWVNEYRERKLASLRQLTVDFQDVTARLREKEDRLHVLLQSVDGALSASEDGDYFHTVDVHNYLMKYGPGKDATIDEHVELPRHTSQVLLNAEDTAQYQSAAERYMGFPVMSQENIGSSVMSVAKQFQCYSGTFCNILDIYPLEDRNILIVYERNAQETVIALFTPVGTLLMEERILERQRVTISRVVSDWLIAIGRNRQRTYDLSRALSNTERSAVSKTASSTYHIRVTENPGKFAIHKDTQSLESFALPLFSICASNPLKICANKTEQYFAVIHHQKSPSSSSQAKCVSLVKKTSSYRMAPLDLDSPPSDVCFFVVNGTEVLLVVCAGKKDIKMYEFQSSVPRLVGLLAEDCPLIQSPTALNVDTFGTLWIGCSDGTILTCKEIHQMKSVGEYLEPEFCHSENGNQAPTVDATNVCPKDDTQSTAPRLPTSDFENDNPPRMDVMLPYPPEARSHARGPRNFVPRAIIRRMTTAVTNEDLTKAFATKGL